MEKAQINEFIEQHKQEAVALLEELGKIPAPSHKEGKRAAFCKKWFEQTGCNEVWIDEAQNVICKFNCDKYEDIVVLMAHTDVVFDDLEELPMTRKGNILSAPGIGDDTANLVNLMMGAKFLVHHSHQLKTGIMIVANSCEEGLGNLKGCKEIFNNYGNRIRAFYSFDCYLSVCTSIPVGSHRYRIQIQTEGGHSYQDFGRDNAIHIAAQIINELYQIELPAEEITTYNVGKITGGTTVNSIPQEAVLLYEYRSCSEKCLKEMEQKFQQVIEKFRRQGKKVNVEILGIRPGAGEFDRTELENWTKQNVACIQEFYDGKMDFAPRSTDANIPLSMGMLANTIGTIRGGKAHTREEWVDLDSIPAGMGIVLSILSQYM